MKIFVLVHGAYHGAWCWQRVIPFFREKKITVLTPTLSGLGENAHLLSPSINLSTHITDVTSLLERENLREVVLVGHSYSGFVVAGVAERVPDRIGHLVYLDAMVPENGQKVFDVRNELRADVREISFNGKQVKVLPPHAPEVFGVTDPEDAAWVKALMVPTPAACYDEPLAITNPGARSLPKTYLLNEIQGSGSSGQLHLDAYEKARGDHWSRKKIPGPHDSMITHPKQLAKALISFAS
jgi:pimeloyl-ACP methyl ester carboxylesterase